MEYKGYKARVKFDEDAEVFHGYVLHLRDVITFEADTVAGLKREFHASVDDYLDFCSTLGQKPERPLSGRLLLRLDPELHRLAAIAADLDESSLNAWIGDRIREAVSEEPRGRRYVAVGAGS